ncbi:hypothetical protein [Halorhabdus amylolytica]|uniref:hypothetical protein n=1 Tax=Halorhabdus amylolytica TaxID=2559573 RepID=UPI0010AA8276|nr:hypothetical protein [Halorhabdus amylolytica]
MSARFILVPAVVTFDHYGLARAAVVLGALTLISGIALIFDRRGWIGDDRLFVALRVAHVIVSVFMTLDLLGAYLVTPV